MIRYIVPQTENGGGSEKEGLEVAPPPFENARKRKKRKKYKKRTKRRKERGRRKRKRGELTSAKIYSIVLAVFCTCE